jgi:hypothetical protein
MGPIRLVFIPRCHSLTSRPTKKETGRSSCDRFHLEALVFEYGDGRRRTLDGTCGFRFWEVVAGEGETTGMSDSNLDGTDQPNSPFAVLIELVVLEWSRYSCCSGDVPLQDLRQSVRSNRYG